MKKIFITAIIIPTIVVLIFTFRFTHPEWEAKLVSPEFNPLQSADQKAEPGPSASPNVNAPKDVKFDASTDLKAELEKVNPQILDSDFE